jgi:predicted metalloprotease with PDZ domain
MRLFLLLLATAALSSAQSPITISVDASDAPRRIFHAALHIPVKPGPFTLLYPKWIPGEHGPTGPIADLASLRIVANGRPLAWHRDPVEMYALHIDVPAGADTIDVTLDYLSPPETPGFSSGASATTEMTVLSWNQVLLYPAGTPTDALQYKARLKVPAGWRYGTALPIERESGDTIDFAPSSLTTLIDSPVISGRYFRTIELSPGASPAHYMNLAADSAEAVNLSPDLIAKYKNLVNETGALFGARHYRSYHFLVSLSDHVAHFGLEHHESSDDRINESAMTDEQARKITATLLSHEMVHSWNGKYRRPAGLATPDYQEPMKGNLLWVYEGLTNYLGEILAPRSGLLTPEEYRENLAATAASLSDTPGRNWRPLEDTAVAAQVLYGSRGDYENIRRSVDYYPEGSLLWLDADVIIRQRSQGRRSLDDFCKIFYGGQTGPPAVKTYQLADIIAALNQVQPHDWAAFFRERIDQIAATPPLGGITNSGWRLAWSETPTPLLKAAEDERKFTNLRYSLGITVKEDGTIGDVIQGSPAFVAGVTPSAKLLAINARQYTGKSIRAAVAAAKNSQEPLNLLLKDGERYQMYKVDYHGGERYPTLERDASKPDLLTSIISPKSAAQ